MKNKIADLPHISGFRTVDETSIPLKTIGISLFWERPLVEHCLNANNENYICQSAGEDSTTAVIRN